MYIYIHIPFCKTICPYCDFPKVLYDKKYIMTYLNALTTEIKTRYQDEPVKSIYLGGGTPTALSLDELNQLLDLTNIFKRNSLIEFTIESNVESLTLDKIKLLKQYGVNRISLGVQSLCPKTLKELNRNHTKEDVFKVINNLKNVGITNISIDYIYGVNPNIKEVEQDIQTFISLDIPHISCYSLIIEPYTIFSLTKRKYIDEDIEYAMYKKIEEILEKNNYIHYEISNYAKEGYYSIHNLNYWNNGSYYGFGLGAVSYLDNTRLTNTRNLTKYCQKNYLQEKKHEDESLRLSNSLILGFRQLNGINIINFKNTYHHDILDLYDIKKLIKEGKLLLQDNYLKINPKYLYLSNEILTHFL